MSASPSADGNETIPPLRRELKLIAGPATAGTGVMFLDITVGAGRNVLVRG
jgi:hypothetical protein